MNANQNFLNAKVKLCGSYVLIRRNQAQMALLLKAC